MTSRGSSAVMSGRRSPGRRARPSSPLDPLDNVARSTSMWSASRLFACQIRHASASPPLAAGGASAEPDHSISSRSPDDHAGQVEPGDLHEPLVRLPHVPAGVDGDAVDAPVVVLEVVRCARRSLRSVAIFCRSAPAGELVSITRHPWRVNSSRRGRYISASGRSPPLTASSRARYARIAATQASILGSCSRAFGDGEFRCGSAGVR